MCAHNNTVGRLRRFLNTVSSGLYVRGYIFDAKSRMTSLYSGATFGGGSYVYQCTFKGFLGVILEHKTRADIFYFYGNLITDTYGGVYNNTNTYGASTGTINIIGNIIKNITHTGNLSVISFADSINGTHYIKFNLIYNITATGTCCGISLTRIASNASISVWNNTLANFYGVTTINAVKYTGGSGGSPTDQQYRYNITYGDGSNIDVTGMTVVVYVSCYTTTSGSVTLTNSFTDDPEFIDTSVGNFAIKATSPCYGVYNSTSSPPSVGCWLVVIEIASSTTIINGFNFIGVSVDSGVAINETSGRVIDVSIKYNTFQDFLGVAVCGTSFVSPATSHGYTIKNNIFADCGGGVSISQEVNDVSENAFYGSVWAGLCSLDGSIFLTCEHNSFYKNTYHIYNEGASNTVSNSIFHGGTASEPIYQASDALTTHILLPHRRIQHKRGCVGYNQYN